jgi:uncharacterized membrane protein YhaH (DUF805 family)
MRTIKLLKVLGRKNYFIMCILSTITMAFLYPYIQSLGNLESWFKLISPLNFALYVLFSVLFGVTVTLHIYNIREIKVCQLRAFESGVLGVVIGFFVSQCPVCVSFLTLFLPATAVVILTLYNTYLNILAIILLLITIYLLGGLEKENKKMKNFKKSKKIT